MESHTTTAASPRDNGVPGRRRPRSSSATGRVLGLSGALLLLAGGMWAVGARGLESFPAPFHAPWWVLAIGFAGSEIFVIHLQFRRDAHSISINEIPIVLALFFGSPIGLILGHVAGSCAALVIHRRQPLLKLVFNLSAFTLEACVAVVAFHVALFSADSLGVMAWLAALVATCTVAVLGGLIVTLVIALHEGRMQGRQLVRAVVAGVAAAVVNTCLALLAVIALWTDSRSGYLLVVVGVLVLVASRAYASLTNRHASLELMYEFTKAVGRSPKAEDVISAVLGQARDLLRGEIAELILLPMPGEDTAHRVRIGPDDAVDSEWLAGFHGLADPIAGVALGRPLVLPRSTRVSAFRAYLEQHAWHDCIVAPLHGEEGIIGVITVADRLGDVSTFDDDDARLFETIANHASVALQNGRLIDRLRYEALHDALTGLPNRVLFHDRVEEAVRQARQSKASMAVMLMDLDRFKEVNDSLGHHNGDILLQEVGARLKHTLQSDVTVARLGGDEFGVLLPHISDVGDAVQAARIIEMALDRPFVHDELSLEVGATIGIAIYPENGRDTATLLQRADVAMYSAKESQAGIEVYAAELDQYSPRRLALVGELRRAIEQGGLEVYYQPKVSLATGDVEGVEALVRWTHPEHGFLPPDDFIPIAEHTGLIGPLTTFVLEAALTQCKTWERMGISAGVAVNLSARSLLDLQLPDDVGELLRRTGVEPRWLTLEITESSVMSDPGRTIGVLNRLHAMGVSLSVDDFGTGYSSLSYLKRLPVDEVKVDKSFVLTMTTNESDAAIVRSIVDLGRNLGLHVLAEGIEDTATWDMLKEFGCSSGQGYLMSRPVPAAEVTAWMATRMPATPVAALAPVPPSAGDAVGDAVAVPVG